MWGEVAHADVDGDSVYNLQEANLLKVGGWVMRYQ